MSRESCPFIWSHPRSIIPVNETPLTDATVGIPAPSLPETVTFTYDGEEYTIDPKTRKGVLNAMTSLSGLGLQQAEIAHDMLPEEIPDMIVLSNLPRTEEVGARVLKATDPDTNLPLSKFTFGEKSAIWKIGDSLVPVFRLKVSDSDASNHFQFAMGIGDDDVLA